MTELTIIGTVSYPVALPGGRHLSPGELGYNIPDSEELRSLEKLGLLRVVPSLAETVADVPTSKTPSTT